MPQPRTAIVVVGMHRSGTSLLARALSAAGFALPEDPMPPQPDNPAGFWEPLAVVRLNNALLSALGPGWDRPGPWYVDNLSLGDSRAALDAHLVERWSEAAATALDTSFPEARRFVVKDPRISLFMPLWHRAFQHIGVTPHYVMGCRDPLEVAASLKARNAMAARQAFRLWQTYVLGVLRSCPSPLTVRHDHLLASPRQTVEELLDELGVTAAVDDAIDDIIDPALINHRRDPEAFLSSPRMATQVKDAWRLLLKWREHTPEERRALIADLDARCDDAQVFAGAGIVLKAASLPEPPSPPPTRKIAAATPVAPVAETRRILILHYHLFKNAGSSVDEMLKRNFGERWAEREFPLKGTQSNAEEVRTFLEANPALAAFSSHTAALPTPSLAGTDIVPIFFVRHPLLRLRSAYEFERKQKAETFGAQLARSTDFAGYLQRLLEIENNRQAQNFQTFRLAFGRPRDSGDERERAFVTLAELPFVGLVEAYDKSLERLQALLEPRVPGFTAVSVHKNATTEARDRTISERVAGLRAEMGPELYGRVEAANADDMAVFEQVAARYGVSLA